VGSRTRHLRLTSGVTGIALVVAAVVGALVGGPISALGVAAGVGLVAASYLASTLVIAWADSVAPRMVFGVGVGMYVIKYSLFAVMLIAVNGAGWTGRIPMAFGIAVGVVAWTASHVWWLTRNAYPYVGYAETGVSWGAPRDTTGGE
jgi:hypothetical protein